MGLPVDLEQLCRIDVGVPLRRRQLDVAEELLDGPQIGALLQQVTRKRMPQRVRTDAEARAAARDVSRDETLHTSPRQASAPGVEKYGIGPCDSGFVT